MTDYLTLNEQQLRQYVILNPQDEEAFQHYLSIMRAKPGVVVSTPEQLEAELKRRINQGS
ncbi:DUF6887 family protein [Nostoc sp. JL33]|uniref:DUF6887 family protein n=1 Tax=Nostoc sp. JL33 TaxID=2815396 RepID=UPI0025EA9713|nr:hypothetical protein [Nostoc sp. JL33]MBN3872782.1 hypothetical protein [Nostoc sp. JL33]